MILENYYGLAKRGNLTDVDKMPKAIEASLHHVASKMKSPNMISVQMVMTGGVAIKGIERVTNTRMESQNALWR